MAKYLNNVIKYLKRIFKYLKGIYHIPKYLKSLNHALFGWVSTQGLEPPSQAAPSMPVSTSVLRLPGFP